MSSPSSGYDSSDVKDFGDHFTRSRQRSRTMSMLTVSSSTTFRSTFDITKTLPSSPTVCSRPDVGQVYGSFIPVRSAAKCLRDFVGDHTTIPRISTKRRRVTFQESSSPVSSDDSSDDDDFPPSHPISYIHRPFSNPKRGLQCPPIASPPSINKTSHRSPSGMHPILAKLERDSRIRTQMVCCSTCQKFGQDYPRCGKCGAMWCSRSCRLVSGKRHTCPPVRC